MSQEPFRETAQGIAAAIDEAPRFDGDGERRFQGAPSARARDGVYRALDTSTIGEGESERSPAREAA